MTALLWALVGALSLLVLVLTVLLVVLLRRVARIEARTVEAPAPAVPAAQVAHEAPVGRPEFVITGVASEVVRRNDPDTAERESAVEGTVAPAVFADIVLRESVVHAASLWHGVRRALTPANRNRIRFEMRQEVKRSRRQRRADLRTARREFEARQRAAA